MLTLCMIGLIVPNPEERQIIRVILALIVRHGSRGEVQVNLIRGSCQVVDRETTDSETNGTRGAPAWTRVSIRF